MHIGNIDPIALAMLLAALALMPVILVCTTCFLKVSMVLIIVRNAIGVQQVPPSIAIQSIALAITVLVMAPVFKDVSAALPTHDSQTDLAYVTVPDLTAAAEPLRRFMVRNTLPEQRAHFRSIARKQWPASASADLNDSDYVVLVPAFVMSELQLAFQIGFVLYVPFVVIDLLISNVLLALGMQMVSPMVISLPLKMLLFVMLDGWTKLFDGLVRSYA
jgi:type III secretion protein R